jgi:transcriptional regulator with XRE-family HTH domain
MPPLVKVSSTLRTAVWARRAAGDKQADLARAAHVHPTTFSALINDLVPIQPGDERVLRIAAVVNVRASDAFSVIGTDGRPEVRRP